LVFFSGLPDGALLDAPRLIPWRRMERYLARWFPPAHPYGFRPGRSQHQALDGLYAGLLTRKVSWVLDLDMRGFFDQIFHEWLVKFVEHRIADRCVVRLIRKWLNAGGLEDGKRMWKKGRLGIGFLEQIPN